MSSPRGRAPRLVLAVANGIAGDPRVRKYVETAVRAGADVTVVGVAPGRRTQEGSLGGARVVRVAVPGWLRRAGDREHDPRHRRRQLEEAAHRQRAAERELSARIGDLKAQARSAGFLERRRIAARIEDLRSDAARERAAFDDWAQTCRAEIEHLEDVASSQAVHRARRDIDWRTRAPEFLDLEVALGPVVDELEADVLHAHDVHLLGVLARSAARRAGRGEPVPLVYDAHEVIHGLYHPDPTYVDALASMEAEYIGAADHVVAVSPAAAAELEQRHGLPSTPTVVRNAPVIGPPRSSLRDELGLPDDDVLLVYSGGTHAGRGLEALVDALALLPEDHHVALVTNRPAAGYTQDLRRRAMAAGTDQRLHLRGYVPPDEVVHLLAGADVGVDPMWGGWPNHELTLTNKLFEFTAAGLGVVVSDVTAASAFVAEHGHGATFTAGDAADLARAVAEVVARRQEIRATVEERRVLWADEVPVVTGLYAGLTGADLTVDPPTSLPDLVLEAAAAQDGAGGGEREDDGAADAPERPRVLIGPMNASGQAWAWKQVLEASGTADVEVHTLETTNPYAFPTDHRISTEQWGDLDWQLEQTRHVLTQASHVLLEFGRPLLGRLHSQHLDGDARMLLAHGIGVAAVCHGSDVRDPHRHMELEPHSAFHGCDEAFLEGFARRTAHLRSLLDELGIPVFVTTTGLLDSVPWATWLPLVVDHDRFADVPDLRDRAPGPLRVGHMPTRGLFKGTAVVDDVGARLEAEGVVEYRRLEGVPAARVPSALAGVDVLVDGIVLGDYGVLACETMAAGRVVVGNVGPRVRDRLPRSLPLVHATPDTLEATLRDLAATDPSERALLGDEGRDYAADVHGGGRSVRVLADFLGQDVS